MNQNKIEIRPASAREWAAVSGDMPRPRTMDAVVVSIRHRGRQLLRIVISPEPLEGVALVRLAMELKRAA